MNSMKRIIIGTFSGLVCGFVCYGLASGGPADLPWPVALQIITNRTLIGFAIGISSISLGHWSIHGLAIGLLFSTPMAFSGLMAPDNPEFTPLSMFIATVVMGMIYGLLIEFVTTVLFKAGKTV